VSADARRNDRDVWAGETRDEDGRPHGLIVVSISTGEMTINA